MSRQLATINAIIRNILRIKCIILLSELKAQTRFVSDYELRELSRILKVKVNWLLGIE